MALEKRAPGSFLAAFSAVGDELLVPGLIETAGSSYRVVVNMHHSADFWHTD